MRACILVTHNRGTAAPWAWPCIVSQSVTDHKQQARLRHSRARATGVPLRPAAALDSSASCCRWPITYAKASTCVQACAHHTVTVGRKQMNNEVQCHTGDMVICQTAEHMALLASASGVTALQVCGPGPKATNMLLDTSAVEGSNGTGANWDTRPAHPSSIMSPCPCTHTHHGLGHHWPCG